MILDGLSPAAFEQLCAIAPSVNKYKTRNCEMQNFILYVCCVPTRKTQTQILKSDQVKSKLHGQRMGTHDSVKSIRRLLVQRLNVIASLLYIQKHTGSMPVAGLAALAIRSMENDINQNLCDGEKTVLPMENLQRTLSRFGMSVRMAHKFASVAHGKLESLRISIVTVSIGNTNPMCFLYNMSGLEKPSSPHIGRISGSQRLTASSRSRGCGDQSI